MLVTRETTEIVRATSTIDVQSAISTGIARATAARPGVEEVRVRDVDILFEGGNITGYRVMLEITHELEGNQEATTGLEDQSLRTSSRRYSADRDESQLELVRQRVLLEDLTQKELVEFDRFLTLTPAKKGSGSNDVSVNHDRHLSED